jgi:hypothetical protein
MSAPLVDNLLDDTVENIRNVLAVVAAATADPSMAWDRTPAGVHLLLSMVDTALEEAAKVRQRWAGGAACSPTAGPRDEADPSLDPECIPVRMALLPADCHRLATVARQWGVLPETLARTLVIDGLADIGRRERGGEA